jgi:flagellar basal-body rod protein FlgF
MDRLIYTAMTGAKHVLMQQAGAANNIANVSTIGFRAQEHRFQAVPVVSDALPTRAFVVDESVSSSFEQGAMMVTGRSLDVAVSGSGWIALQMPDGSEAYTRAGSLDVNTNGLLQTKGGYTVAGSTGGPIDIPADNRIEIGPDGTISVVPTTGSAASSNAVGQIKLVNPPTGDLVRGDDGLFRLKSGQAADPDATVQVVAGALEGSNVNPAESMVQLISLSRQFEMQIKLLDTAQTDAKQADQLLSLS